MSGFSTKQSCKKGFYENFVRWTPDWGPKLSDQIVLLSPPHSCKTSAQETAWYSWEQVPHAGGELRQWDDQLRRRGRRCDGHIFPRRHCLVQDGWKSIHQLLKSRTEAKTKKMLQAYYYKSDGPLLPAPWGILIMHWMWNTICSSWVFSNVEAHRSFWYSNVIDWNLWYLW